MEVEDTSNAGNVSLASEGDPGKEPEDPEDPEEEEEDNEQSANLNNTIVAVPENKMDKLHPLCGFAKPGNLKSKPLIVYPSLLKDKDLILSMGSFPPQGIR